MKRLFSTGVLEAFEYPEGWLFLRWVQNRYGQLQKKLVKDFMETEKLILERKLKGWFTSSELAHKDFQMLLHKVGARFMAKDAAFVYFNKWVQSEKDLYQPKKVVSDVRITA